MAESGGKTGMLRVSEVERGKNREGLQLPAGSETRDQLAPVGFSNDPGDFNCFLNSALQSL